MKSMMIGSSSLSSKSDTAKTFIKSSPVLHFHHLPLPVKAGQPLTSKHIMEGSFRRITQGVIPVIAFINETRIVAQRTTERRHRKSGSGRHAQASGRRERTTFVHRFGQVQRMIHHIQNNAHSVFCQRAGFIETYHRHGAKRFNCGQFTDQGILFEHALGAERQCNGHDREINLIPGCERQSSLLLAA